jgi:hypothetical protein
VEQCIYLHRFASVADARRIIGEFIQRYKTEWLIECLGHRTSAAVQVEAVVAA